MAHKKLHLIKTVDDVIAFFRCLNLEGLIFHPDTDFNDYVALGTKQMVRIYTRKQAKYRNELLNDCFAVCSDNETDIYELALAVFYPEMMEQAA